ncbi:AbrB family transcriptional regulator [Chelativorans sp. AA-79]|uniref:AbrB family transcriptional regulator n=1 Tax=Chelativorans sp. AA-79 TaxID=3028735 RepID=UPI0023F88EB4|nr:AbrB family transcriptional regulator [Chelativorans sp. AA-79]WEX10650.1 AbrB family transcriptional regulator [Chelativorans sp. AA-79]
MAQGIKHRAGALICLTCAVLAGAAAFALHTPLAWVLGPLITTAIFSIAGVKPWAPLTGRRFGQILIGGAIGLNLTPPVVANMVGWIPAMIVAALVAMLVGSALARGLAHFGRIDLKTAYFAMMPGGLSEMANIGAQHGAQNEPIALAQALRVALVVCILPSLIVSLGIDGTFRTLDQGSDLPLPHVALLIGASLVGVGVVRLLRLNNPWMIGALIGAALLTATGHFDGRMPQPLFYLGQFLIGIAIGARFRREIVVHLVRLSLVSSVFVIIMTAIMLGYALVLAWWDDIDIASAALSSSPGGFAEMAATAETLHLNVALVTGFHIIRALFVNSLTTFYWTALNRIGFFTIGARKGSKG